MSNAIQLEGVTKTFGTKVAVRDLDMVVPRGMLVGYIGPNGAGKTTTIRMIMSILFQDSGRISVLGHGSALDAKERIGYLPEERGLYKKMKVGSFLRYISRLKGFSGPDVKGRVRQWLERVELGDVENKRCDELSKGMQQKPTCSTSTPWWRNFRRWPIAWCRSAWRLPPHNRTSTCKAL